MKFHKAILFAISLVLLASVTALAHKGASGVVKERMDGMSAMKDAMAVIGNMLNGKSEFDQKIARDAAVAIKQHGGNMLKFFPDNEESRQHASQARIELWDDWQEFEELSAQLIKKANELDTALIGNDEETITSTFQQVGKACSECHRSYRIKN